MFVFYLKAHAFFKNYKYNKNLYYTHKYIHKKINKFLISKLKNIIRQCTYYKCRLLIVYILKYTYIYGFLTFHFLKIKLYFWLFNQKKKKIKYFVLK